MNDTKIEPQIEPQNPVSASLDRALGSEASKLGSRGGPDSKVDMIVRYGKGEDPDKEGTVKYAGFNPTARKAIIDYLQSRAEI
ncbi:MAG: hypothetical protein Q7S15_00090 [bacterium]|nr:hypothetical protein [bacterium]